MKVYLIRGWLGHGGDFDLLGVFTTREAAEAAYCEGFGWEIDEIECNKIPTGDLKTIRKDDCEVIVYSSHLPEARAHREAEKRAINGEKVNSPNIKR
jgi:hypothetical protein